jgi:hypothetical protein
MSRRTILALIAFTAGLAGCGSTTATHTHTGGSSASGSTSTATAASNTSSPRRIGFENVPLEQGAAIAPASSTGRSPADGVSCAPLEQLAYHIHAHLLVFVDGRPRALPGGIGIPGSRVVETSEGPVALPARSSCYYWLHTHAPDGVIHIESPTRRIYTLGDFFDIWRQPLTRTRIGTITGRQTWSVNGKPWRGDPRAIRLLPHTDIQLSVGRPVVGSQPVEWAQTSL